MDDSVKLYKEFIDSLVSIRESVEATRVRSGVWHPEPPQEQVKFNQLLNELSQTQRDLVADIIQEAANSAIHDVLVILSDNAYELAKDKTKLAVEPFDTELYYDFEARSACVPWPDDA